jgi:holo-[acyl-carrier protein] synthase
MIIGIGSDMMEISQMKREISRNGQRLEKEIFTDKELRYCQSKRYPERHLAARFAAKEALFKALSTGKQSGMLWQDIEIQNVDNGKPLVRLSGQTKKIAKIRKVKKIFVSLSHTQKLAMASVVLES